jgi:hypothetical protein
MTDLSRGARARRGGRRPGWLLLTALLVLAIGASSALVFTNRAELLKLAVILALWAAVVAAFVSVIYRRQSDVDQARARDLKLVYDLQLDREISARREYELTVESQLRRELASELRAQADDEVSALRAELAALRTNLEILFDAELSDRPALETERKTGRGHSDWDREIEGARERVNRVASVRPEESGRRNDDSSIIDVHEEPLVPTPPRQPAAEPYHPAYTYQPADSSTPPRPRRAAEAARQAPEADRGGHWRPSDREAQPGRDEAMPPEGWTPPAASPVPAAPAANAAERQPDSRSWAQSDRPPQTGGWVAPEASPASGPERFEPQPQPQPVRRSHRRPEPPPQPESPFVPPPPPPEPAPQQQRPGWSPPPEEPRHQEQPAWQPVSSGGQWLPAGTPGSHWNSGQGESSGAASWAYDNAPSRDKPSHRSPSADEPPSASTPQVELRGRHSSGSAEAAPSPTGEPVADWSEPGRRARSRHSTEYSDPGIDESATPAPAMSPPPPPTPLPLPSPPDRAPVMSPPPPPSARHRGTDPLAEIDEPPSGGQSVAELLARLQTTPSEGGRRRRRED